MSPRIIPTASRPRGVRVLDTRIVTRPSLAADGGRRVVRVIGGRDGEGTGSGVRVVGHQARSTGTRAGIRIIGRAERGVPRSGIRVIGGQDAR